ncbi:MAG: FAD-binding oxidoreductase [Candidatus Hodarchaeota archaeon]
MARTKDGRLKISIKGHLPDLLNFSKLVKIRKKKFKNAPPSLQTTHEVNQTASILHPVKQFLVIQEITDETGTTKTFKLVPDTEKGQEKLAYFRPGQYLSIQAEAYEVAISRPYSISSSPSEALKGFYEITMKKVDDGFLTRYAWDEWKVGTRVTASGPEGNFYHEPLRDTKDIVAIAGGSGITPFRSMAREIMEKDLDLNLIIMYGSSDEGDIIFKDELEAMARKSGKVSLVHVLSCDEVHIEGCEKGFITADLIKKHARVGDSTFFVCGPAIMQDFILNELKKLGVPRKRIRKELSGETRDVMSIEGYPKDMGDKTFSIKVHMAGDTHVVPASARKTVLVALERANLKPPSRCRSGECGYCRSLLVKGNVFINLVNDGRRIADKELGYFHPCSSYPLEDLEIVVPLEK